MFLKPDRIGQLLAKEIKSNIFETRPPWPVGLVEPLTSRVFGLLHK